MQILCNTWKVEQDFESYINLTARKVFACLFRETFRKATLKCWLGCNLCKFVLQVGVFTVLFQPSHFLQFSRNRKALVSKQFQIFFYSKVIPTFSPIYNVSCGVDHVIMRFKQSWGFLERVVRQSERELAIGCISIQCSWFGSAPGQPDVPHLRDRWIGTRQACLESKHWLITASHFGDQIRI